MYILDRPIAHRGLHTDTITENSMASFRNAIEHDYYIETDVRLLSDGEVVVFHDANLKRVCGIDVKIADLTTEDIKSDKYLLPNGEHIPLFKEMLELVDGKTKILLEFKWVSFFNNKLEEKTYELIKGKEDYITVQSFNPASVAWFKNNAPEFTRGLLASYINNGFCNAFVYLFTAGGIAYSKSQFLSFNIETLPSRSIEKLVRKKHLRFIAWTVRKHDQIDTAKKVGIENIIFENMEPKDGKYKN